MAGATRQIGQRAAESTPVFASASDDRTARSAVPSAAAPGRPPDRSPALAVVHPGRFPRHLLRASQPHHAPRPHHRDGSALHRRRCRRTRERPTRARTPDLLSDFRCRRHNRRKGPLTRISSSTWPKISNTTVSVSGSAGPMYGRSELRSEIDHDLTADMAGRVELDGCADVLDGEGQGRFGRSVVVRNLSGPPVRGRHHRARPRHRPRPRGRGACLRVLPERESPSGAAGTKPTGRPPAARAPLQPPEPRACLRYVIDCRR